jgi:DNA-binding PadR family transcriptional regulator
MRLRRYYRLTDAGADAVREEAGRMRRAVKAASARRAALEGDAR